MAVEPDVRPKAPKGWRVRRSEGTGKWYFVDPVTGQACWDKPTDKIEPMKNNERVMRTAYQWDYPEKGSAVRGDTQCAAQRAWKALRGGWTGYSDPKVTRDFLTTTGTAFVLPEPTQVAEHRKIRTRPPDPEPERHEFQGATTNGECYKGIQPPRVRHATPKAVNKPVPSAQHWKVEPFQGESTARASYRGLGDATQCRPAPCRPRVNPVNTSGFTAITRYKADFTDVAYETSRFQRQMLKTQLDTQAKLYADTRDFQTVNDRMYGSALQSGLLFQPESSAEAAKSRRRGRPVLHDVAPPRTARSRAGSVISGSNARSSSAKTRKSRPATCSGHNCG